MVNGSTENLRHFGYDNTSFTVSLTNSCEMFTLADGVQVHQMHTLKHMQNHTTKLVHGSYQVDRVVSALPFGRNMRIPYDGYIGDMLANIRRCVPDAVYCYISADAIDKVGAG